MPALAEGTILAVERRKAPRSSPHDGGSTLTKRWWPA